jgi:(p)ppGpp synthase/HD superfamily hydrolase
MDLNEVRHFARQAHEGQSRKFQDEPYWVHPKRVGDQILEELKDKQLAATGYLHDTIEDTDATFDELEELTSTAIASWVDILSHDSPEDKVRAIDNSIGDVTPARIVKLYDRLDNVRDLEHVNDDFAESYAEETVRLLDRFAERELTEIEKELVGRISDTIQPNVD